MHRWVKNTQTVDGSIPKIKSYTDMHICTNINKSTHCRHNKYELYKRGSNQQKDKQIHHDCTPTSKDQTRSISPTSGVNKETRQHQTERVKEGETRMVHCGEGPVRIRHRCLRGCRPRTNGYGTKMAAAPRFGCVSSYVALQWNIPLIDSSYLLSRRRLEVRVFFPVSPGFQTRRFRLCTTTIPVALPTPGLGRPGRG